MHRSHLCFSLQPQKKKTNHGSISMKIKLTTMMITPTTYLHQRLHFADPFDAKNLHLLFRLQRALQDGISMKIKLTIISRMMKTPTTYLHQRLHFADPFDLQQSTKNLHLQFRLQRALQDALIVWRAKQQSGIVICAELCAVNLPKNIFLFFLFNSIIQLWQSAWVWTLCALKEKLLDAGSGGIYILHR